jgi:hypothetical protein
MHLVHEPIEVLPIAEPTKPRNPHDDVGHRSVQQRYEPALDLISRFTPFPAEFSDAPPVAPQGKHARERRAPHEPQDVHAAPVAQAAGMKDEEIENGTERRNQHQVNKHLHPRASRCGHRHLRLRAGRYTRRRSKTSQAFGGRTPALTLSTVSFEASLGLDNQANKKN